MANNVVKFLITGDASGLTKAAEAGEQSIGKIGPTGSKVGTLVGDGLAVAGAGLLTFGAKSLEVALQGESSQAALDTAIKNTGQTVASVGPQFDALEAHGAKYGETNDDVRQGLATLVTATGSTKTATADLSLVQDISTQKHLTLANAAKLVGKVEEGNIGSIGRFGLATKDAAGNTLTQAQAMDELRSNFKGAADEFAGTDAGKLKAFQASFEDLEDNLGTKLLPLVTRFGTDFVDGISKAEKEFDKLPGPAKDTIEAVGGAVAAGALLAKVWGGISPVVGGVRSIIGHFGAEAPEEIDPVVGGIESLGTTFTTAADQIVGAVGGLTTAITSLGPATVETAAAISGAMTDADTAVTAFATSTEASALATETAFTGIGGRAELLAGQIAEAKAASNDGVWGAGGFAGTPGGGSGGGGSGGGSGSGGSGGSGSNSGGGNEPSAPTGGGGFSEVADDVVEVGGRTFGDAFPIPPKSLIHPQALTQLATSVSAVGTAATVDKLQRNQQFGVDTGGTSPADQEKTLEGLAKANDALDHSSAEYKTNEKTIASWQGAIDKADNSKGVELGILKAGSAALDNIREKYVGATGATQGDTSAVQANTIATASSAAALTKYGKGLTASLSPALGAISAEQGLTTAKQNTYLATVALDTATKQYGKNSPQAIQASKDLASANNDQVTAAVSEQTSLVNLATQYQATGKSSDDFKNTLEGLVSQGDITQDQANGLVFSFGLTKAALDNIPGAKTIGVAATGIPAVIAQFGGVKATEDTLGDKHIRVTADTSQAQGQLGLLQNSIENLGATYKGNVAKGVALAAGLVIQTIGSKPATVAHNADGGFLPAHSLSTVAERGPELARVGSETYFLSNDDAQIIPHHALSTLQAASVQPAQVIAPAQLETAPVNAQRYEPASSVTFAPGSIVLQAAPGEDAYQFGLRAVEAIKGYEKLNGKSWRDT